MIAARQTSKYFPRPSHIVHFRLKQVWKNYNKIICNLKKLRFNFSFKVCVQLEIFTVSQYFVFSDLLVFQMRFPRGGGKFCRSFAQRESLTNVHPAAAGGAKAQKICNFTSSSFHLTNQCRIGAVLHVA